MLFALSHSSARFRIKSQAQKILVVGQPGTPCASLLAELDIFEIPSTECLLSVQKDQCPGTAPTSMNSMCYKSTEQAKEKMAKRPYEEDKSFSDYLKKYSSEAITILFYFNELRVKITHDLNITVSIRGLRCEVSDLLKEAIMQFLQWDNDLQAEIKGNVLTIIVGELDTPVRILSEYSILYKQMMSKDEIVDDNNEVLDIAKRYAKTYVVVHIGEFYVILDGTTAVFVTKWMKVEDNDMKKAAMETLRDPDTIWQRNECTCTNQIDVDAAQRLFLEQHNTIMTELLGASPSLDYSPEDLPSVIIILERGKNRIEYNGNLVYKDNHPMIDMVILALHKEKRPDLYTGNYPVQKPLIDFLREAHKIVAMFTDRYVLPKADVLLKLKRIPFSVDKGILTVVYNSWAERNEIEKMELHLHFKDVVYDGTDTTAPLKNEALRVYFTSCKRYYYYSIQPQGEKTLIYISGLPDFAKYCISCEIKNNRMEILSFFYKLKDNARKESIKSVHFKGYGPRGMLLVKFIAMRLGVRHVDLKDVWEVSRIKSPDLKSILKAELEQRHHHMYLENKKKIDPWIAFFRTHNTMEKAAEHGYYGGFGFVTEADKLTAKPENIVCASCIYV